MYRANHYLQENTLTILSVIFGVLMMVSGVAEGYMVRTLLGIFCTTLVAAVFFHLPFVSSRWRGGDIGRENIVTLSLLWCLNLHGYISIFGFWKKNCSLSELLRQRAEGSKREMRIL